MFSWPTSFSSSLETWTTPAVVLLLVLFAASAREHWKRSRRDLPPSPKGLPLIGHLHLVPKHRSWIWYRQLAQGFSSPLTYLNLGGRHVVILNEYQAAVDILEKRSVNYSSRPRLVVAEYIAMNKSIILLPYGDAWRRRRSAIQRDMSPHKVKSYLPIQITETKLLMRNMVRSPEMWRKNLAKWSGNIVLKICYGLDSESECEEAMNMAEKVWEPILEATLNLVDAFPFLDLLPDFLSPWRRRALQLRKGMADVYVNLIHQVNQKVTSGELTQDSTFAARLWSSRAMYKLDELDVAYLAGDMLEAGIDTTYATMVTFVLAMGVYPAVLTTAQAEVDRICGERSPTMDDMEKLPYVAALCKETMRWRAIAPLGVPRQATTTEDDYYKGMRIPAGAIIIANQYGMGLSKETYGQKYDAESFEPRRWIDMPEAGGNMFDGIPAFGFGRRVCPGKYLAVQSLFPAISNLCHSFDIKAKEGVVIDAEKFNLVGLVMQPEPFQCNITPRAGRAAQIKSEAEAALEAQESLKPDRRQSA